MFPIRSVFQSAKLRGLTAFRSTVGVGSVFRSAVAAQNSFATTALRPFSYSVLAAARAGVDASKTKKPKSATAKKTATKAAAAKKPVAKKATGTRTKAKTTKAKKAVKAKPATKKKAVRTRSPERLLADKQKAQRASTRLFITAALLKEEPPRNGLTLWTHYFSQTAKQAGQKSGANQPEVMKQTLDEFRALDSAALEKLRHEVEKGNEIRKANYLKWVNSHTAEEIRTANLARRTLNMRAAASTTGFKRWPEHRLHPIHDARQVQTTRNAFSFYAEARSADPTFKYEGENTGRLTYLMKEFKALAPADKEPYQLLSAKSREKFVSEFTRVYGHPPKSAARV